MNVIFITGLGLLLVDLFLRLSIDDQYIFLALLIPQTDIGKCDIMLVLTICLKFFTVGSPKLL